MKALLVVPAAVLAASLGFLAAELRLGRRRHLRRAGLRPSARRRTATSRGGPDDDRGRPTGPRPSRPPARSPTRSGSRTRTASSSPTAPRRRLQRVGTAALESLLEGPDSFEQGYGLRTEIPAGTQLLGLEIDDGIAHVDLTSEFESGGGTASMRKRFAQVVYTLTQFPTVRGVLFSLDGEPRRPRREGRPRQAAHAPRLRRPPAGDPGDEPGAEPGRRRAPSLVRGSANVFEANIGIEILDQNGDVLVDTFTTATCGTGCRGTFRASVAYEVDREQDGTIVVHDDDAAGTGTYPHEVRIPVRLVP